MPTSLLADDPKKKKKKVGLKQQKQPKKKRPATGKRGARDAAAKTLGETVRKRIQIVEAFRKFEPTPGIKKTGTTALRSGESLKEDEQFNDSFRGLGPAMDEFFSTATMREFMKGLLADKGWSAFSEDEQKYINDLVDVLSAIRAPTEYVGFSIPGRKGQHPTSRPAAYFEDPYLTTSEHAKFDNLRRDYVQRAVQAAIEGLENARGIVLAAGRAAIEYTLNYWMAPVTASNVQPHSKLAGVKLTEERVLAQPRWREYLKTFYVDVLEGKLRDVDPKETKKESLVRLWEPLTDPTQTVPPSPLRETEAEEEKEEEEKKAQDKIELKDASTAQADTLAETLDQSGLSILGQNVPASSNAVAIEEYDLEQYGSALPGSGLDSSGQSTSASDAPGPFGSGSPTQDVGAESLLQLQALGQDQMQGLAQDPFAPSSASPGASNPFTSSLSEEVMEQAAADEAAVEVFA